MWVSSLEKIISGGQTGVDRGALDAALDLGFPCGGFCPEDRAAEDGRIPSHYPLTPLPGAGYRERTLQNVIDADATVILCQDEPTGGTRLTIEFCNQLHTPCLFIDARTHSVPAAVSRVLAFVCEHEVRVLNFAGPRESGWPAGRDFTYRLVRDLLTQLIRAP
jgi:hypothetical protein